MTRGRIRPDGGRPRSKVARVIAEYDRESLGEELAERWLATGERGMSLRDLATYCNEQLLEAALEHSEMNTFDVDVETMYEQLTDDDVSSGTRTNVERRLERNGVDVDALRDDFVTHQAVHTYLREYRGVEQPEPSAEERREKLVERVQKLQDRSTAVTVDAIETLQRADLAPDGEFDVVVDIQVIYTESGEQHNVFDLLEGTEE